MQDHVETKIHDFEVRLQKIRDDQLTLEHYTERYIPLQMQNLLIENMRLIHEGDKIKILMDKENGLTKKLSDELLDSTNLAKGTIFENVLKIN